MSNVVCRFLTGWVLLGLISANGQGKPDLGICGDGGVSLGQSKEQVGNALAICCTIKHPFVGKDESREYSNQITFEARLRGSACQGLLLFDRTEKLVYAQRQWGEFAETANPLDLARAFVQAINHLLPARTSIPGSDEALATSDALIGLTTSARGSSTVQFTVGKRTVEVYLDEASRSPFVLVTEQVGDINKWDRATVSVRK